MHKGKLLLLVCLFACGNGSVPTDFAGTYSVTIVEGADACNLQNGWQQGNSSAGISATITQDGSIAQVNVGGLTGAALDLLVGTSTFGGAVKGDTFTATVLGTKTKTSGACSYTINATLQMSIDANNAISGTIDYTPATNNDPSCGVLNTCTNSETVSGARTTP